ncbi:MAG: hypothetical protein ACOX3G_08060 [Armatimonadota bacterium]|jgi:hypothetical protein
MIRTGSGRLTALFFTLIIAAGVSVGSAQAKSAPSVRVVYVDTSELARLHPGWRALDDMRLTLSGTGLQEAMSAAGSSAPPVISVPKQQLPSGTSREELVAKAARDASAALDKLEARKYNALQARRESMRAYLLKSSESEWKTEAKDLQAQAAVLMKEVDDRYAAELVNARLRQVAAKAASSISQKEDAGIDRTLTDEKMAAADAEVARIMAESDAEKDRITADINAKIAAIKQASERRVEEQIAEYNAEQSAIIADSMASARSDIARRLGPTSTPDLFAVLDMGFAQPVGKTRVASGDKMVDLRAAYSALQRRIDNDVRELVLSLASQKGLQVSFERKTTRMNDATGMFANLIRKCGWSASIPASAALGNS